jgi:ubiquinone/menaquinone biosynthesis C-methylase UbiE
MLDVIGTTYWPRTVALVARQRLARARYIALHEAVRLPLIGGHRLASLAAMLGARRALPARNRALEAVVRQRYWQLLATDFDNARRGLYPMSLLFDLPFATYASNMPRFLKDAPRVVARIGARNHRDLPQGVDLSVYPAYYRRTFHWQTDGYFSRHSAELYDLGVELLFVGTADVMRRQVLADVLRRKPRGGVRLLDVGTGTGRFLEQAASSMPGSELHGVDLSPWYVGYAKDALSPQRPARGRAGSDAAEGTSVTFEVANAEALPFASESFDVVTSVFMLHELPRHVRRTALAEMRRVLVPGGLLVLGDAAQPSESPELGPALEQFSKDMHEPFFSDYLEDDLAELLRQEGFVGTRVSPHFVSKVVSATKGVAPAQGELIH